MVTRKVLFSNIRIFFRNGFEVLPAAKGLLRLHFYLIVYLFNIKIAGMQYDLSKLKKRPSFPFENIGVATAFSPRLESVLSEAKRIKELLGATLTLIHAGEKTRKKEQMLEKAMGNVGLKASEVQIVWAKGDPVNTLLQQCKLHVIDLLILGALQKENLLKFYLGSFARKVSRKAKCSVLLLTHPSVSPSKVKRIVVNGVDNPKTIHTLNTSVYFASKLGLKEITVVKELESTALAMTMADDSTAPEVSRMKKGIQQEEEHKLHDVIKKIKSDKVALEEKTIRGKAGFAVSKYARDKKADLLVINSPDTHLTVLDRIFTHDIEYILADLPCDVLIVHSRI